MSGPGAVTGSGAAAGPGDLPDWLRPFAAAAASVPPERFTRFLPPAEGGRPAAVLVLFGEGDDGPDLLLVQRSDELRAHAGQPAFPGGAEDPGDDGPVATALREAVEETGLDPAGVEVITLLPALFLPVSDFVVTPVAAWWRTPGPVRAVDPAETAVVARVPIAELVDPAHRLRIRHPSGYVGPAFDVRDLLVWGFTGGILDVLLELGGWAVPWDRTRVEPLPADRLDLAARTVPPSES